jgi:ATPase subunit of ABC transporter with duplicated ATPase domains
MDPVPPKLFPFLHHPSPSSKAVERDTILHVTFTSKTKVVGGDFTDYTARYGAMRNQDSRTLRESLMESLSNEPPVAPPTEFTPRMVGSSQANDQAILKVRREIEQVAARLHLVPQLDVPMIALSNGQQRRARILRQLIRHPRLLLLEEPFGVFDYNHV